MKADAVGVVSESAVLVNDAFVAEDAHFPGSDHGAEGEVGEGESG